MSLGELPAAARVVAVVPVFDPGDDLVDLVRAIVPQVVLVILVDDGSTAVGTAMMLARCTELGARVVRHEHNRGIAAALNTGVEAASAPDGPGAEAVLTLDQDSAVTPGFVGALLQAWGAALAAKVRVGLVAPERVVGLPDQGRGRGPGGVLVGRDPIQSGTLVPVETVRAVGPFDEALVIDGVDADFALRCLDAGLAVVIAPGLSLGHRLGARHEVRVGRRRLSLTRSAPSRYYYLARNRMVLLRRHGRRHPGWAAGQVVGLGGHLALVLTLVPDRQVKAREVARGIRDAARGVTGPRPAPGAGAPDSRS